MVSVTASPHRVDRDKGIAIVGIGCRFPGGADSPDVYWKLLCDGIDAVTELPPDRFDINDLFDPDPAATGRIYTRWGGFLERVDAFDADFFGIAPREARRIDPQQRLLLEVVWEAFEDAGLVPARLAGTDAGVFVGISTRDYVDIQALTYNRHRIDAHVNAGTAMSIAANRVSYLFDLRGPSIAIDTACSSSLTALHLACRSLAAGECDLAIAGGVGILLSPEVTVGFCKASMLSPDGRCRAFDARANGYVRSEGAGAVVLKSLDKALADGDPIHAVILGSAVNQDGRTTGLSLPSSAAQQAMLRQALRDAGVAPADIRYVEAHGTGTPAGDPIEAEAIGRVLAAGRAPDDRCLIGSAKTNLGHLEAAAGMAGLIKTALVLKHRCVPPNLHFSEPNPAIPFDALQLRVPTTIEPLPPTPKRAVAGVNSFGFGGANAHVVLEGPPEVRVQAPANGWRDVHVLTVSARSPQALREQAERYRQHLCGDAIMSLHDLCYTAAVRRSHHADRLAVVGRSREEFIELLNVYLDGGERAALATGHVPAGGQSKLAFVFPGMGPQWWGMGRQLLASEPVFRHTLDRVDEILQPLAGWSLLEELSRDEETSRIGDTNLAHVANLAIQVGLAALWRSWGVIPDAIVGHSSGEMAAACVSGALSLSDTVYLAYHRGRLQHHTTGTGRMLAAAIPPDEVAGLIADHAQEISLAAINSPSSVTLSGTATGLQCIADKLAEQSRFARFLPVQVPYHGPQMERIRDEFLAVLGGLCPGQTAIPLVSEVSGEWIDGRELEAGYWWRNVRQPVQFAAAIDRLIEEGCESFVEVGPHPVLAASIRECAASHGKRATVLPSLRREEDECEVMLGTLAGLHVCGRTIDWSGLYPSGTSVALPQYPWQRERHWFDADEDATSARPRLIGVDTGHPLLGRRLPSAQPTWETELAGADTGYLEAHVVQDTALFPGAGYVEMALAAGRELWGQAPLLLEDVQFRKLMFLRQPRQGVVQLHYHSRDTSVEIHSNPADDNSAWILHTSAKLREYAGEGAEHLDLQVLQSRCASRFPVEEHYAILERRGYSFGDAFRTLRDIWLGPENEALARVAFAPGVDFPVSDYQAHPALLDAAIQLFGAVSTRAVVELQGGAPFFPVSIRRMVFHDSPGARFWTRVVVRHSDEALIEGDAWLVADSGRVAVSLEGLRLKVLDESHLSGPQEGDDWVYELRWEESPLETVPGAGRSPLRPPSEAGAVVEATADPPQVAAEMALELEPRLSRVALGFTLAALDALGYRPDHHRAESMEAVMESLGVVSRHRRLFAALMGMLRRQDPEVLRAAPRDEGSLRALLDALISAHPAYAAEAALLRRGGPRLADILRGEVDAREVLLSGESLELLAQFYYQSPACRAYHDLLGDSVAAALDGIPDAQSLRVLEIGAGTGAATASILPRLPASAEYWFTDISPHFLAEAKVRFGDRARVRFATLDIESEPGVQGLEPHSFDLVIAANVLHVTKDLDTTLRNVRCLLRPNGMLALLEVTRRSDWLNLVFGLLEGWWRYTDVHLRADGPMLSSEQWHHLLEDTGFDTVTGLFADASATDTLQTVLLAQAPAVKESETPPAPKRATRHWLVFADESGAGRHIADSLDKRGERCTLVYPNTAGGQGSGAHVLPPLDTNAYTRLLQEVQEDGAVDAVLHLWSLDAPAGQGLDTEALMRAQDLGCGSVLALMQALNEKAAEIPELWFVTAGGQGVDGYDSADNIAQSPLWGLGRVITSEHSHVHCRLVDLGPVPSAQELQAVVAELCEDGTEDEVALRDGRRFVRRLRRTSLDEHGRREDVRPRSPDTDRFRLETDAPGVFESLQLREAPLEDAGPGELAIRVIASGLNFRDVLQALDVLPPAAYQRDPDPEGLGIECTGIVVACGEGVERFRPGDEVIALAAAAHGSRVIALENHTVAKPAHLSFEEAASVLNAFVTAEYALNHVARIAAGERILIHSATGAVGLAAIQLCKRAGVEIFATAGTPEKRAYLNTLGIEHVMDSRSLAFAEEVLARTGGEGVDVVLNSLTGEAMLKGLSILRPYGRFIELGKRDIFDDAQIGLLPFQRCLSFHAVDLTQFALDRPAQALQVLEDVVDRVADGALQVVPITPFDMADAEQAFRLMMQARHIGKVVLTLHGDHYPVRARTDAPLFRQEATYLITGGLGGFGLAVAEWMAREGAGSIVLMSRTGEPKDNAGALEALRASPARITVAQGDAAHEPDVQRVLMRIRRHLPPLRGIVHAAMVLDDDALVNLDQQRFRNVLSPKIAGAWNLHRLTRQDALDFFVLFSSVSAVVGQPMQGNYAAANAFLDALAEHRRAQGLPGLTVAWGAVTGVGYVSRHPELAEYLGRGGFEGFTPEQALNALNGLMRHDFAHVIAARMDWRIWAELNPQAAASGRFRAFVTSPGHPPGEEATDAPDSPLSQMREVPAAERRALLVGYLVQKVARVLGKAPDKVDAERPLTELGFDSLMAVELATTVSVDLGIRLPVVEVLQGATATSLADRLLEMLKLDADCPGPATAAPQPAAAEPEPAGHPLSFEQQRFWLLDRMKPGDAAYNVPAAARLTGGLDVKALENSVSEVLRRHEVLRAAIHEVDGRPVQRFAPPQPLPLPLVDLSALPEEDREGELARQAAAAIQQPFDLGGGPLMRATLFRLAEQRHVILLVVHHIACDAWSMNMLVREVATLYGAYINGQSSPLAPPPFRYLDYIREQAQFDDQLIASQLDYWQRQLAGAPVRLRMPTLRTQPAMDDARGGHRTFELSADLSASLQALGQRENATLFMVLVAAFQALLHRYSEDDDICVGTAVSRRTQPGAEAVLGCFINTLVLRSDLSGEPTFLELLRRVRQTALQAFEHQDVSFEKVVEAVQPDRGAVGSPLFQAMLVLHNARLPELDMAGLELESLALESGTAVTDLMLLVDSGERLRGTLEYNTERFDRASMDRLLGHFRTLLEAIVADPEKRLSALPLLTDTERRQVLEEWNGATDFGAEACLHQLVEAQVERSPEAVAVVCGDTSLTYAELDGQATRLACHLRGLGIGPEAVVGVCLPRSPDLLVTALAILKAGGAYLPLDPSQPLARLRFMLADAEAAVLVTKQHWLQRLPACDEALVVLDADRFGIPGSFAAPPAAAVTSDDPAYVIYTSGSTGEPKGVMIPHRAICNQVRWRQQAFPLSEDDAVLQRTPPGFDPAIWEIFGPLAAGARLIIPPPEMEHDGARLVRLIVAQQVTTMQVVPSVLDVLLDQPGIDDCRCLRRIFCGGEPLTTHLVQRCLSRLPAELHNLYGPTEATIDVTHQACRGDNCRTMVPIGRPIANVRIRILDRHRQPVPVGIPGELHIGGEGLALGYLNRPALTSERFIADPFIPGERLYRSGDLGRWLPDGSIEFLGRIDDQLKVRGFRVEPAEIEAVLADYPGVREAAVVPRGSVPAATELAAFVVAGGQVSEDELRTHVVQRLPGYMVPSSITRVDSLPRTSSGKADRARLARQAVSRCPGERVAPRDPVELELYRLWEEFFPGREFGVTDDFFSLGGHSLLAMRIIARIQDAFGRELPVSSLIEGRSIEKLACLLRAEPRPRSPLVAIRPHGSELPVFWVHPVSGTAYCYVELAHALGEGHPIYGLEAVGLGGMCDTCVEDMARRYVRELRRVQSEGPYLLGGWSMGGVIAFEMARQLEMSDQEVALLAVLDVPTPVLDRGDGTDYQAALCSFAEHLGLSVDALTVSIRDFWQVDPDTQLACVLEQARLANLVPPDLDRADLQRLFGVFTGNLNALRDYVPGPYGGSVTLFDAEESIDRSLALRPHWDELVHGGVTRYTIPGGHHTMLRWPHVEVLARRLGSCLEAARGVVS